MHRFVTLLAGVLVALALPAAPPWATAGETNQAEPLLSATSPRFGADVHAYLTARGTALGFDLEAPYSELQFIRVPAGFGAALRITVVFRGARDAQAGGDVWEDRIVVPTFAATRDGSARARYHRDFTLPAGDYKVEVTLEDLNGGRVSKARGRVKVPEFGAGALGLGDLVFGFCRPGGGFVRLPSRRYEADLEAMCVEGSIYDRRPADSSRLYRLAFQVRGETGEVVTRGDTTLSAAGKFTLRPAAADLFLGSYTFELEVREQDRRWRAERTFEVETLTLPRGQNYSTVVEILSYIATPEEYDELRRATTDEERKAAWNRFWARRDPTPDTARNEALLDLFARVRFANANFGAQAVAGWRTDQGRIYIRYGAPDQIEERPATFYDPPLQIWQYYAINRRFVFADREGFGRWELVSPLSDR